MKKTLSLFVALIPLLAMAQANFSVTGTGSALKEGDKIYLVYKQQGKVIFDSTIVRAHTFKFNGIITEASIAQVYKNENPMLSNDISESAECEFYAEKGNILISCTNSFNDAVVSGTSVNEDNQELKEALKPYFAKRAALDRAFYARTPEQQKDINVVAEYRAQDKKILNEMAPLQFRFIETHPDSYISLVTLKRMLKSKVMLPEINNAYTKLSPAAKASIIGKEIAEGLTSAKKAQVGTMAYDFTLPDINGNPVSLAGFKGKYVLVDFWASWCLPCREENPNVILAYNKFKAKGFTVLSVSVENKDERKNWLRAIKEDHLPWTQVLDGEKPIAKIKTIYGIATIPSNVLIDPAGKIIAKDLRDRALLDKLAEVFDSASLN